MAVSEDPDKAPRSIAAVCGVLLVKYLLTAAFRSRRRCKIATEMATNTVIVFTGMAGDTR